MNKSIEKAPDFKRAVRECMNTLYGRAHRMYVPQNCQGRTAGAENTAHGRQKPMAAQQLPTTIGFSLENILRMGLLGRK